MNALTQTRLARLVIVCLLALFAGGLAACGDANDDTHHEGHTNDEMLVSADGHFQAELTAMPTKSVVGDNMVHLELMNAENEPISGATIEVEAFMPMHGHGTPEAPTFSEDGDGLYTISNINYTMPGIWELRIDITSGETQDRIVAEYTVE